MSEKKTYSKLVIIFLVGIANNSCVSIIDFEPSGDQHELVIFGRITNALNHDQAITVRQSDLDSLPGLSFENAIVEVLDDQGNVHSYRFSSEKGKFLPEVPFTGIPGVTYQAFITVRGTRYVSTPQKMPLIGAIDTTYFEFQRRDKIGAAGVIFLQHYLQILIDSRLDEHDEPMFLKWDVDELYIQPEMLLPAAAFPFYERKTCYVFRPYDGPNILLFSGEEVASRNINRQVAADVILDNSFNELRGYRVVQSSFSKEALNYWRKVDEVSSRVGSLFEIPPAPVTGNFSNEEDIEDKPLGFFEVSKMDTTGLFINRGEYPVVLLTKDFLLTCPEFSVAQFAGLPLNCFSCLEDLNVVEGCYDCLSLPNSTLKRPTFLN